mgnify:CR=1 FL=1
MAANAYDQYKVEMAASREAEHAGDIAAAIAHLERAHILGQRYLLPHLATHWRMLALARTAQNGPETRGQILRLVAAIPGYIFGWVPVGTPAARMSPLLSRCRFPQTSRLTSRATASGPAFCFGLGL